MNGPARPAERFHVELSAVGAVGIRDAVSGELHAAASLADALIDTAYLNEQHARRNEREIRTHLASGRELATAAGGRGDVTVALQPERVFSAAGEWSQARENTTRSEAARLGATEMISLKDDLAAAEAHLRLASARIGASVRNLYRDGEDAHRALAETSRGVPLLDLAELVGSNPTLFGPLADVPANRFYASAGAAEQSARATALADAIVTYHDAGAALNGVRDSVAEALGLGPDTTAQQLSAFLADRITTLTTAQSIHPHNSTSRAADRLRALLAAADQKTRDAVLIHFPDAAPLAPGTTRRPTRTMSRDL